MPERLSLFMKPIQAIGPLGSISNLYRSDRAAGLTLGLSGAST